MHINRAKYHLLRVLVVLAENEDPYFLDFASRMKTSYNVVQLVAREATKLLQYLPTVMFIEENPNNPEAVALEALKATELVSYDSNFVKLVTENCEFTSIRFL